MKILVINAGSSSLKSSLFEGKGKLIETAKFHVDGIGLKRCKYSFKTKNKNLGLHTTIKNHEAGVKLLFETLKKVGIIKNYSEISAIGHRVVHGGEHYTNSTVIDAKTLKTIERLAPLAPLHNPANLAAIKACKKILPRVKQVAVFDTAFHQTMSEKAFLYGIPYEYYEKHKIRRYGFHGTSHKFVINEAKKLLKKSNLKIISCHIGNGSSITASVNGKSIDTSMGFTPLEGVIMGTRCGNIDPSIIFHMNKTLKLKLDKIENILNEESGLKGISGISQDMRDIYKKSLHGDKKALLSIDMLSYQIAKYCGAYIAAMGGLDALVFTGGIGENAFYVRDKVVNHLKFLKGKFKVLVIKTNEELQIALETKGLIKF